MITEKDIICPSCKSQIEVAYCGNCKENIFLKPVKTTIVNVKDNKEYDVFIGRRNNKPHWGNPFTHLDVPTIARIKVKSREEAIKAFEDWLMGTKYGHVEPQRRKWILINMINMLKGKVLGCYCKPKSCHGDVYVKLLSEGCIEKYL